MQPTQSSQLEKKTESCAEKKASLGEIQGRIVQLRENITAMEQNCLKRSQEALKYLITHRESVNQPFRLTTNEYLEVLAIVTCVEIVFETGDMVRKELDRDERAISQ